jgi:azurin
LIYVKAWISAGGESWANEGQTDDKNCTALRNISEAGCRQFASSRPPRKENKMKRTFTQTLPIIALGCSALLYFVTGCSRAPEAPPKEVTIQADDKMRFDVTAFDAKPGQKIVVTFKNIGTTPKFSMGHNFVLLDRTINTGNVQAAFLDKASMEAAHDYVPPGDKQVLAHSKLLGPAETDTVTFNAPYVPGEYLYLCSFPGHYSQGTKGFMTVK